MVVIEKMRKFEVWAPRAKTVELKTGALRIALKQHSHGNWEVESPCEGEYSFVVDGGSALPDPRSAWQPHGVEGPSKVVDHSQFAWTDSNWQSPPLSSAVVYELHIGTFTQEGTFQAAIQKLDYLKGLGITHVELMPVNEYSGNWGWGYDGVDLYAPHHAYGEPKDLKALVNAAHARGLSMLLDVVYNHLGPVGNYIGQFGPYFTELHETPWGPAINLDSAGSDPVRRFICDNAIMWLRDYHFDGLRLDAIHALIDSSANHLLKQLALEVEELEAQTSRHLVLIAESDLNDPRVMNEWGIHAQWSDDFHHALHSVLTGERDGYYSDFGKLGQLAKAFRDAYVYDGCYSEHRGRTHGASTGEVPGHRFLAYLQNHDQIGNRAKGDRTSHLLNRGRLKIGAALVLTSPFIPMLFQGEEWSARQPFQYFTQHEDPDMGEIVSEGRRKEFTAFGWKPQDVPDPQNPETFYRSKLNWSDQDSEMLEWHRNLIQLRKATLALSDCRRDKVETDFDEQAKWIKVMRGGVEIIANLGDHLTTRVKGTKIILASDPRITLTGSLLRLPTDSVALVSS